MLTHQVSAESLGYSYVIWYGWPVSPGSGKSYMVEFCVVHEMGEVTVVFSFN